jgi:hypothetical protein
MHVKKRVAVHATLAFNDVQRLLGYLWIAYPGASQMRGFGRHIATIDSAGGNTRPECYSLSDPFTIVFTPVKALSFTVRVTWPSQGP